MMGNRAKIKGIIKEVKIKGVLNPSIGFNILNFNAPYFQFNSEVKRAFEVNGINLIGLNLRNYLPQQVLINSANQKRAGITIKCYRKIIYHEVGHMYFGFMVRYRNEMLRKICKKMYTFILRKSIGWGKLDQRAKYRRYMQNPDELFAEAFSYFHMGCHEEGFLDIRRIFLENRIKWSRVPVIPHI